MKLPSVKPLSHILIVFSKKVLLKDILNFLKIPFLPAKDVLEQARPRIVPLEHVRGVSVGPGQINEKRKVKVKLEFTSPIPGSRHYDGWKGLPLQHVLGPGHLVEGLESYG